MIFFLILLRSAMPTRSIFAKSIISNLCEFYYQSIRLLDVAQANAALASLSIDEVIERRDMSRRFWHRVGEHKARGGISLPNCFCVSLAQELSAEVVTSDHGEFDRLVPLNIVPILFIR